MKVKVINKIRVLEEGVGLQIVLLHSAGQPPEAFTKQINLLSPYALIITPNIFDLAREATQMNFNEMAIELKQVLNHYPEHKKIFIGCSMGGNLALAYAAQFPIEVSRLMICDTAGLPLQRSLFQWVKEYIQMNKEASNLPKEVLQNDPGYIHMIKEIVNNPLGIYKAWRISAKEDLTPILSKINTPTQILWGSKDHFIPVEVGKRMVKMLPNATFETVTNPSHFWFYLDPEKFAEYVVKIVTNL